MHDVDYVGDARVTVPKQHACPSRALGNGGVEYQLPAAALASFGWDAGLAEAMDAVRMLQRPHAAQNIDHNAAVESILGELDRLRRIGR